MSRSHNIKNRIGDEHTKEFEDALNSSNNILLVSPTDSGKTYSTIEYAKKHPRKRIALIMPVRSLVDNTKKKYEGKRGSQIRCGYGLDFVHENKYSKFICTTYDTFLNFDSFDIVIIDEAHTLAGHGNFRTETIAPLLSLKSKVVLLSGTPEVIEHLEGYERVEFIRKSKKKSVEIIRSKYSAFRHAFNLINEHKGKDVLMIRINHKKTLDELYSQFKQSKNMVMVYSEDDNILMSGQNEKHVKQMRKGVVPEGVDVILCTSIFDAGVSFDVRTDIQCYAIEDRCMPNAIDMVQLLARVRSESGYQMSLTIVGEFGDYGLRQSIDLTGAPTTKQLVKEMSQKYSEYSELDEENYRGLLDYYNIKSDVIRPNDIKITSPKYASKLKLIQLAKNFHNFPNYLEEISRILRENDREQDIKLITGKESIHSEPNQAVMRMFTQLEDAGKLSIPFPLFINNKYKEKLLTNLIGAVDEYNKSLGFQDVIHELLQYSEIEAGESVKMDLTEYHDLGTPQQGYIKEVARLLFDEVKFQKGRSSAKLVRSVHDDELNGYLYRFYKYYVKSVA